MRKFNKNTEKIVNALGEILNTTLKSDGKITKDDEKIIEKSLGEGFEGILGALSEKIGIDIEALKKNQEMDKKVFSFIESIKGNEKFIKSDNDTHKLVIIKNKSTIIDGIQYLINNCLYYRTKTIKNIINQTEFTGQGVVCIGDKKTCKAIKKVLKSYIEKNKEDNLENIKIEILEL
jgi:hypothetical protein